MTIMQRFARWLAIGVTRKPHWSASIGVFLLIEQRLHYRFLMNVLFWSGEAFHASDRLHQIQYGKYFQTAYQHLRHSSKLKYCWEIGVVGHRSYISKARTDIADAGD